MTTRIGVKAAQGPYEVVIAKGGCVDAAAWINPVVSGRSAVVVADEAVRETHAAAVAQSLASAGWTVERFAMVAEEPLKRMAVVEDICDRCLASGQSRSGVIVAVGGGLTGDVAGFAAATYMRGIDLVQVPTTLLAMVDASIGGKTGINLPLPGGGLGKNLAGAFWPPRLVLADPETLSTLPTREFRSGLAECVKHGLISDRGILEELWAQSEALAAGAPSDITPLLARCIKVKQQIVAQDEREQGRRMVLNLGHTFAHAIEPIPALDLTHGEAVAIGLVAAIECAAMRGLIPEGAVGDVRDLLESLHLPTALPTPQPVRALCGAMQFDKKVEDGQVQLVLPTATGVVVRKDVSQDDIERAWRAVGAGD